MKIQICWKLEKNIQESRENSQTEVETTWNRTKNPSTNIQDRGIGFQQNNNSKEWMIKKHS